MEGVSSLMAELGVGLHYPYFADSGSGLPQGGPCGQATDHAICQASTSTNQTSGDEEATSAQAAQDEADYGIREGEGGSW